MKFSVLTLFPEMFDNFFKTSIIGRAIDSGIIESEVINIRDFSNNKHKSVDDYPYGGGSGMVMQLEPLKNSLESIKDYKNTRVVYLTPKGKTLTQQDVKELSNEKNLILVCGHYEGIDQRFIDRYVTDEISIGDFVLTGGELPAMVLMDSISRMIDGVLSSSVSFEDESHYNYLLEYPHYTRPAEYNGDDVPKVLLSGNHQKIDEWRLQQSVEITLQRRPELIDKLLCDDKLDDEYKQKIHSLVKKYNHDCE